MNKAVYENLKLDFYFRKYLNAEQSSAGIETVLFAVSFKALTVPNHGRMGGSNTGLLPENHKEVVLSWW